MSRRGRWAAVGVVVVVAGRGRGAAAFVASRPGWRPVRAPSRRASSEETATRRHRPHVRRRPDVRSPAAASPCSTATATGGPTSTSPAASTRPALFRNESPVGGALRFARGRRLRRRTSTRVTGAYPLDVDADGVTDLAVLRVGRVACCCAASATAGSSPRTRRGACRRRPAWTTAFSATWEGDAALPTLAFGNYVALDDDGRGRRPGAPTTSCSGPAATGTRLRRRRSPLVARLLHAVDPVQRLGRLGPPRPAGDATTATTTVERRGAAVAGRAGRGAARSTRRPTAGRACRSGAWGSRART